MLKLYKCMYLIQFTYASCLWSYYQTCKNKFIPSYKMDTKADVNEIENITCTATEDYSN